MMGTGDSKQTDKYNGKKHDQVRGYTDPTTKAPTPQFTPSGVPDPLSELMALPMPLKFHMSTSRLTIKKYSSDIPNLRACMSDNDLDETNLRDVAFASTIVALVSSGVIPINNEAAVTVPNEAAPSTSLATESNFNLWRAASKMVVITSICILSSGSTTGNKRWYDSYRAVFLDFLSEKRFGEVCNMIIHSPSIEGLFEVYTLGDIESAINVFKYRVTWLSSPGLVKKALNAVAETPLLGYLNPQAVDLYRRFDQAGVAAQIASGPLNVYCKGNIDPLKQNDIPKDIRLRELSPINAPNDEQLLRQVKIILEVYEIDHGNWYQGKRAARIQFHRDTIFRLHATQLRAAQHNPINQFVQDSAGKIVHERAARTQDHMDTLSQLPVAQREAVDQFVQDFASKIVLEFRDSAEASAVVEAMVCNWN